MTVIVKSKLYTTILLVLASIVVKEFLNSRKPKHPDAGLNIEQLIKKYGYPLETHEVTTEDGYILTLHRIPHGRDNSLKKRIPILFMHGFSQSATEYVNLGPEKALSFLLADKGYDIWLGNARGTTWSRKHVNLDPNKDWQFWDYNLHEIGVYDTAAFLDHIVNTTGQNQLHYVGYSQGTIVFFILMSEKPEYSRKIKLMTALAPSVFLKNPSSPFISLAVYFRKFIETFFDIFWFREILSQNDFTGAYMKHICNVNSMFVDLCVHHNFAIQGYNWEGVNKTFLSLIFSRTPAGASPRQMMHILQLMDSDDFRRYDFGKTANLQKYGQEEPPSYNLSKASAPVALYYAKNDWCVNIKNIVKVMKVLPNVVTSYLIPSEKFNHDDFIHSHLAPNLLYHAVIEDILKY